MSIDEQLDMERQYRDHESTPARLGGRGKFTGCHLCGSQDGMQSVHRDTLAQLSKNARALLGSWYSELGNDEYLFRPCYICNWNRNIPDGFKKMKLDEMSAWLDRDPMSPDYEALAAEPEPVLASPDSCESAGLEG